MKHNKQKILTINMRLESRLHKITQIPLENNLSHSDSFSQCIWLFFTLIKQGCVKTKNTKQKTMKVNISETWKYKNDYKKKTEHTRKKTYYQDAAPFSMIQFTANTNAKRPSLTLTGISKN